MSPKDNAAPNNSMDVRAKQRISYLGCPLNFGVRGGGFAPRHFNRWAFLGKFNDSITSSEYIYFTASF